MSKTLIDSTSLQNKVTSTGINRCAIAFGVDNMTFSGQTGATKCKLQNLADPTNNSDGATKSYVDQQVNTIANSLKWKDAVQAKSDSNLDANYTSNQTLKAKVNQELPDIDGATLAVGDRILVSGQTQKKENGIYDIISKGSATEKWELTRSSGSDEASELTGATAVVIQGTLYSAVVYSQANNISNMTDDKEFVQISTAVNADDFTDGLVKNGARVKVKTDDTTIGIVSDAVSVVANGITSTELANDAVQNSNLADGAVGTNNLQLLSVENGNLAGQITGTKLQDNTITSNLYGNQSIPSSAYQLRSIQSSNIGLEEVQSDNIQNNSITSDKLQASSVDGQLHIANNSIVSNNYASGSVGSEALASNSVGSSELKANAVITSKIASGNITTGKLDSTAGQQAVDTTVIRDDAITNDKLAPSSVDTANIINGAIDNTKLADGSITSNKFSTLTELNVAGDITANSLTLGGSSSTGNNTYALCKMIFNHIDLAQKYTFTSSFKRICNNIVQFDFEEAVIAVDATARLMFQSETGHASTLQFVLGVRFYIDSVNVEGYTTPVNFDTFKNNQGTTHENEATMVGFATDNSGSKRIHSVSWWARESTGNGLIIPQGQDFVSIIKVVNDSSNKKHESWSGTELTPV